MVDVRQSPSGAPISITGFPFTLIQADVFKAAVGVSADSDVTYILNAGTAAVFMPGDIFLPVYPLIPDITNFSNYRYRVESLNPGPGIRIVIRNTIPVGLGPNDFTWRIFALRPIP